MKDIDIKICSGISLIGILFTCYLWTFVSGGNHWELFGTDFEKFLIDYGFILKFIFSSVLLVPIIFKRSKSRVIIGLLSFPVFLFLSYSLTIFLD